jgi:hypothetical protein
MPAEPNLLVPGGDLQSIRERDGALTARLTDAARAKFRALERARQRAYDLHKPSSDRLREAHRDFRRAEDEFDKIRYAFSRGQLMRTVDAVDDNGQPYRRREPDTKAYERAQAVLDRARAEFEDLRDEARNLEVHWQALGGLCTALENWLRNLPRQARITDYTGQAPSLKKGATPQDALMEAERELQALAVRRSELETAPIASSEVKANIRHHVAELNVTALPDLSRAMLSGDPADIRYTTESAPTHSITPQGDQISGHARVVDPLALAAWLFPDALIERLEEEADALAGDDADAITAEERETGFAEVAEQVLATEREAEFWTTQLEQSGVQVLRRRDADPRAVLGIVIEGDRR